MIEVIVSLVLASGVMVPEVEVERVWSVDWDALAECESHGQWNYGPDADWGSRLYHGGLQHDPDTWTQFKPDGFPDFAYLATPDQQKQVAERVLAAQGLGAWPACTRALGWR